MPSHIYYGDYHLASGKNNPISTCVFHETRALNVALCTRFLHALLIIGSRKNGKLCF